MCNVVNMICVVARKNPIPMFSVADVVTFSQFPPVLGSINLKIALIALAFQIEHQVIGDCHVAMNHLPADRSFGFAFRNAVNMGTSTKKDQRQGAYSTDKMAIHIDLISFLCCGYSNSCWVGKQGGAIAHV